jgi:hypothetical protein
MGRDTRLTLPLGRDTRLLVDCVTVARKVCRVERNGPRGFRRSSSYQS